MKRLISPQAFSIFFAVLFVHLFLFRDLGINWPIYVWSILGVAMVIKRPPINFETGLTVGGTLLSSALVAWHHSTISFFTSIVFLFISAGVILEPRFKALHISGLMSLVHSVQSQLAFIKGITQGVFGQGVQYRKARTVLSVAIPVLVIVAFGLIYEAANPIFEGVMAGIHTRFEQFFTWLWERIDPDTFWTFIAGLLIANFILLNTLSNTLKSHVSSLTEVLARNKVRRSTLLPKRMMGLKMELKNGVIMLIGLNALLLAINVIDINWVWFGFEFEGEYLKQFVHEGTSMLIFSIMLSMAVVLFYFRGNLNFYKSNGTLKILTYAWIIQNMVLVLSVAIRNYWYIHYYGMAYKRIGVFLFLLATLIGLLTVLMKVKNINSSHFLLRWNSASVLGVLLLMSCFNWDIIIAKYNFEHSDRAFVHLNFMSELTEKALPYLQKTDQELAMIEQHNQEMLQIYDVLDNDGGSSSSLSRESYRRLYMSPSDYQEKVAYETKIFKSDHESKHWLEWNYADHKAFNLLN